MKLVFLTAIILLSHCAHSEGKWRLNYAVQSGLSRNILNQKSDLFIPQLFNVERLYVTRGYTSFVPGITLRLENQHFFWQAGLDYNRIQVSTTEYSEYAYLTGNAVPHYYYNFIHRSTHFDKLNAPVSFGLHLMNRRFIQLILSMGWVFGKVCGARYYEAEQAQHPTNLTIRSSQNTVNPFLPNSAYLYTKTFTQFQYAIGTMIGQHWQFNFSIRQGQDVSIQYSGFAPGALDWESIIPSFSLQHKEKVVSLLYWFR